MEASSNLIVSLYSLHSNFLILFCGMYLGEVSQIIFLSQNVKKTHTYIQFMSQLVRKYCIFIIYAYMWPVRGGEKGKEEVWKNKEWVREQRGKKRRERNQVSLARAPLTASTGTRAHTHPWPTPVGRLLPLTNWLTGPNKNYWINSNYY